MTDSPRNILLRVFSDISDPRRAGSREFTIAEILVSALCAVICGATSFREIATFTRTHLDWFREFLAFKNDPPSHQTYFRVLGIIDPEELEIALMLFIDELLGDNPKHIAIDGKALRGSRSAINGLKALHLVSAWAVDCGLMLGQIKVDDKSNEITAFPELLSWLALEGTVVTIDAMGCQKEVAKQIVEQDGDYVLALKDNHPKTCEDVETLFNEIDPDNLEASGASRVETQEKGHGREEKRVYTLLPADSYDVEGARDWTKLKAFGKVESYRLVAGEESLEVRYFLSSIEDINRFEKVVRGHWSIENHLHWSLDVSFNEDACKIHDRHRGENMSVLRRIALMLLKRETTAKNQSLKGKMKMAGWDARYLAKVVCGETSI